MTNKDKKICVICGKEFTPNSPSQKMCGSADCLKARRKEYTHKHADMYREFNRQYRQLPHVKEYRASYDKQYQVEHKEQIKEYKKIWYQKKRFLNALDKGEILKNIYWFSLTNEEKQSILDKLNK